MTPPELLWVRAAIERLIEAGMTNYKMITSSVAREHPDVALASIVHTVGEAFEDRLAQTRAFETERDYYHADPRSFGPDHGQE